MIELLLIILLCFLLVGVVSGHWMVYGGPNLKIFKLRNKMIGVGKPRGKTRRQIKAVRRSPQNWAASKKSGL